MEHKRKERMRRTFLSGQTRSGSNGKLEDTQLDCNHCPLCLKEWRNE